MLLKNQVLEHTPTRSRWRVLDMDASRQDGLAVQHERGQRHGPKGVPTALFEADSEFVAVEPPSAVTALKPFGKGNTATATTPIPVLNRWLPRRTSSTLPDALRWYWPALKHWAARRRTIYKYLRTWWRNGQNRQALTPLFHRRRQCCRHNRRPRSPLEIRHAHLPV